MENQNLKELMHLKHHRAYNIMEVLALKKHGYYGSSIVADATKAKRERYFQIQAEYNEVVKELQEEYYNIDIFTQRAEEIRTEMRRIKSEIENKYKIAS